MSPRFTSVANSFVRRKKAGARCAGSCRQPLACRRRPRSRGLSAHIRLLTVSEPNEESSLLALSRFRLAERSDVEALDHGFRPAAAVLLRVGVREGPRRHARGLTHKMLTRLQFWGTGSRRYYLERPSMKLGCGGAPFRLLLFCPRTIRNAG